MNELFEDIVGQATRHGLAEAANHFSQAASALSRREWESANAQLRSGLEALFNGVARIRLASSATGGNARQELERSGVLQEREARVVQTVIALCGSSGSHAGTSSEQDATARLLLAAGVASMGLALLPELTRVEDVLGVMRVPEGGEPLRDSALRTTCPACGEVQALSECAVRRDGEETVYVCRNGCQVIVVVGKPGDSPWPGRGYRIGPHVIRNARELVLPTGGALIVLPASPAALKKK